MKITRQYLKKLIKEAINEISESTIFGGDDRWGKPAQPAKINPIAEIKKLAQQIVKAAGPLSGMPGGKTSPIGALAERILELTNNIIEKPPKKKGMMDL